MLPDRVSNPVPLTYESGALPIALRGPASCAPCPSFHYVGWSGGATVLGKRPVLGRPKIMMIIGQGPIALAAGAGGGRVVWTFLLSSIFSCLFLPLSGRRPGIG